MDPRTSSYISPTSTSACEMAGADLGAATALGMSQNCEEPLRGAEGFFPPPSFTVLVLRPCRGCNGFRWLPRV